jgi:hypothetical protein
MSRLILLVSSLFLSACASTTMLRDKDYGHSETAAHAGNYAKALEEFPTGKALPAAAF